MLNLESEAVNFQDNRSAFQIVTLRLPPRFLNLEIYSPCKASESVEIFPRLLHARGLFAVHPKTKTAEPTCRQKKKGVEENNCQI